MTTYAHFPFIHVGCYRVMRTSEGAQHSVLGPLMDGRGHRPRWQYICQSVCQTGARFSCTQL